MKRSALIMLLMAGAISGVGRLGLADNGYTLTTLANFGAGNAMPGGIFSRDGAGNLFGTSIIGGTFGYGTVYRLDAANNYALSTLASLNGNPPGNTPPYLRPFGAVLDPAGNVFGATNYGGTNQYGSIYKLDASNNYSLSTLVNFDNVNGRYPGYLVSDVSGNIYGTAGGGGTAGGYVFKLDAGNNYAMTPVITYGAGGQTSGLLSKDAAGNIYGITGGTNLIASEIFRLDPSNASYRVTLSTIDPAYGNVTDAVTADGAGNIYGIAHVSGSSSVYKIFKLDAGANYALTTIGQLNSTPNQNLFPFGLLADSQGNVFGTRPGQTGFPQGSVFELVASENYALKTLATFGGVNGAQPVTNLQMDALGNIYGQASLGGVNGQGTVFMLSPTGAPEPASVVVLGVAGVVLGRRKRAR